MAWAEPRFDGVSTPIPASVKPASFPNGPTGVLVLHGFTGSPQSLRPLAVRFAEEGHSVELPLLPGHGTKIEDMVPTRFDDWYQAAEAAYADLASRCERVVVVGLSMGGTLATLLAIEHDPAALIVINPQITPPPDDVVEVVRGLVEEGVATIPGIGGDIAKENTEELAYAATPVQALMSFIERCQTMGERLGGVTCPVLVFTSAEDHVVDPVSSDALAAGVSGPVERVTLEHSYHVATLDNDAKLIEDRASAFIKEVAKVA
jgi:carboxylesterase